MAKLFDEIKKDNTNSSPEFSHSLNIFFSRLLFCYFAEDTNIFEYNQFSHAVESHTRADGSDLDVYLNRLFWVLNTPLDKRGDIPHYLNAFPYVNGGLFKEEIPCPKFTSKSRQLLIDSGDSNDWSAINPDIFGSMFQAVISPEHRGGLGAHYTSVPNIMKVIEPLFLNDLKEEFENASGNEKKLRELLHRITKIRLFDPACGSGNFLIIAYKELRRLEMLILKELGGFTFSGIHLNNFYGIELDDFAHEIAKLSLWLAEHQMNVEFFNEFGRTNPTLPLQDAGQIVCGNACRLDWEKVCPKSEGDEIYIMGNPPYIGARKQNTSQKDDISSVFSDFKGRNGLDYISCWFYKGAEYIENTTFCFAFVSTNSICQGNQVSLLWPLLFNKSIDILFANQAFKWINNAKDKAGVSVVIIGLKNRNFNRNKILYRDNVKQDVVNISPYLTANSNLIIFPRNKPLRAVPEVVYGNQAIDGGFLTLTEDERNQIISNNKDAANYILRLYGGNGMLNGINQYCIWVNENNYSEAQKIPDFKNRFEQVYNFRLNGGEVARSLINIPYRFRYVHEAQESTIIIPSTSTEDRIYLPVDIKFGKIQTLHSVQVIYDAEIYILSFLLSKIHFLWVKSVAGGLETRIGYSNTICYNTFPFPELSESKKSDLELSLLRILAEREKHPEKTLAQLYDPDKMPEGLKEAHRLNDEAVERCYRSSPFKSDEERLEYLFKLYEKMIKEEKEKGTLFAEEKKTRKKK
jgi:hypothetical protein